MPLPAPRLLNTLMPPAPSRPPHHHPPQTTDLTHILQEAGIDFRDCLERQELVQKLLRALPAASPSLLSHIEQLAGSHPGSGGSSGSAGGSAKAASSGTQGGGGGTGAGAGGHQEQRAEAAAAAVAAVGRSAAEAHPELYLDEQYVVGLFQR